jgi:hypothetical protein
MTSCLSLFLAAPASRRCDVYGEVIEKGRDDARGAAGQQPPAVRGRQSLAHELARGGAQPKWLGNWHRNWHWAAVISGNSCRHPLQGHEKGSGINAVERTPPPPSGIEMLDNLVRPVFDHHIAHAGKSEGDLQCGAMRIRL